jgi:hypothetical protein
MGGTNGVDTIEKLLLALEDPSPAAREDFAAWTRKTATRDGVDRAEVEDIDEEAQRAHTNKKLRFYAFASLWLPSGLTGDVVADAPEQTQWFLLRERLAFDRSARRDEARRWAGIKKTTPWGPVPEVDRRIWQIRYTNHGQIAKAYHATVVRYRQNVVLDGSAPEIGAISELWWTNVEDLVERFYASEEAEQLLAVDVAGFVGRPAYPTVTAHETLRVGSHQISERAFL